MQSVGYYWEYAALKDSIFAMESGIHADGLAGVYAETASLSARNEQLENYALLAGGRLRMTVILAVVFAVGMSVGAIMLWRRRSRKRFDVVKRKFMAKLRRIAELESEKHRLIESLGEQESVLNISEKKRTVTALQALRSHEFIGSLSAGLKQLLLKLSVRDTETRKALRSVLYDIDKMDNDSTLKEFFNSFENVNSRFFDSLSGHYPNLTPRELRMCALVKLGLSSKEIADITFREVRSVEAVRNRLRKKFSLQPSDNLAEFLKQF